MNKDKKNIRKILFSYIASYKIKIILSLVFSLASVILTLLIPIMAGEAIDLIAGEGRVVFEKLYPLLIKAAAAAGAGGIAQWIINILNNDIAFSVTRDIRRDAFEKIEKLPLKYIDSHSAGDIVSRIIADTDVLSDGLLLGLSKGFGGIITIIGTLMFMISVDIKIAMIVFCLTPISLFAARFIAKHSFDMFRLRSETQGRQTAFINEMIGEQKTVCAFSYEDKAQEGFDKINSELRKCSVTAIFFSSLTNPSTRFINSFIYAAVGLFGAISAIGGGMSVGALACFLSYANQYTKPFNEISGVIAEFQNALASGERIAAVISEPEEEDKENAKLLTAPEGNIDIKGLSFSYSEEKPLITGLDLSVMSGKHIAIVGPTGCGKTTLINLLMRFYDPNEGDIYIDGVKTRDIKRRSLRKNFGMVLQDTWLRSGTVRENITMGKPDATDREIIAAAKASHADSFIRRLPNGYDTYIPENGGTLSKGEKQLLCITRVMLCLPPMLILDEATSSIDTRTELKISEAFTRLMAGKTSFIVAHRLSTIKNADMILVMKDGNVIEKGTHNELLKQNGFYRKLYNSQFEE